MRSVKERRDTKTAVCAHEWRDAGINGISGAVITIDSAGIVIARELPDWTDRDLRRDAVMVDRLPSVGDRLSSETLEDIRAWRV